MQGISDTGTDSALERRRLLTGGGAVALGLLGASAASVVAAPPAAAAGYGYTAVNPYRTFDSRYLMSSKLRAGYYVDFDVLTDWNGITQIPSSAVAVTFNLTITQTESRGWLLIWPADESEPLVSTINWVVAGLNLANGGTVGLGYSGDWGPGSINVGCDGDAAARTHFIVDITGYYS